MIRQFQIIPPTDAMPYWTASFELVRPGKNRPRYIQLQVDRHRPHMLPFYLLNSATRPFSHWSVYDSMRLEYLARLELAKLQQSPAAPPIGGGAI